MNTFYLTIENMTALTIYHLHQHHQYIVFLLDKNIEATMFLLINSNLLKMHTWNQKLISIFIQISEGVVTMWM